MKFLQTKNEQRWVQQGFTLVEALVSLLIVMVTLTTLGSLFINQRQTNVNARMKSLASTLAQYQLETLRFNMRGSLPPLTESQQSIQTVQITRATSQYQYMTFGVEVRIRDLNPTVSGTPNCVTTTVTDSTSRCVRVRVRPFDNSANNPLIYETETVFTDIR